MLARANWMLSFALLLIPTSCVRFGFDSPTRDAAAAKDASVLDAQRDIPPIRDAMQTEQIVDADAQANDSNPPTDGASADAGPPPLAKGQLLTNFQNGGTYERAGTGSSETRGSEGKSIVVANDGTVTCTGLFYNSGTSYDLFLIRFNPAGDLDSNFGVDGIVQYHRTVYDFGRALLLVEEDRIVVGGSIDLSFDDPTLWRFARTGVLDVSFGASGGYTRVGVSGETAGTGLARDPSTGSYYLVGGAWGNQKMFVVKYHASGHADSSFATGAVYQYSATPAFAYHVAVDSAGRVVVVGRRQDGQGTLGMALWRFLSDGTLDTSFNGSGLVIHDGAAGQIGSTDSGNHVLLNAQDDIYVIGSATGTASHDLVVWKYQGADGQLDATFANNGIFLHNNAAGGNGSDKGYTAAFDSAGNLVIGGESAGATNADMAMWRVHPDGVLDTSFGTQGVFTHDAGGAERAHGIAIGPTGRIHAIGNIGRNVMVWALE